MKCSECVSEGKKSSIHPSPTSFRTAMGGLEQYYDEDGEWHYHDPNYTTRQYGCTNGHKWETKLKGPCPAPSCGWPNDK